MFGATKMDGKKTANGRAGHTIVTAPNVVNLEICLNDRLNDV